MMDVCRYCGHENHMKDFCEKCGAYISPMYRCSCGFETFSLPRWVKHVRQNWEGEGIESCKLKNLVKG
jgi:hypothetical protein